MTEKETTADMTEKKTTASAAQAAAEETKAIEAWVEATSTEAWLLAAVKATNNWGAGKEITQAEFQVAIQNTLSLGIHPTQYGGHMPLPEAKLTIRDGALGVLPANATGTQAIVGTCSSGAANTVYQFNNLQVLQDTLGTGPLVEMAAHVLSVAGGPVMCVKIQTSTAGTLGTVTRTGTGQSVVTVEGNPKDSYACVLEITTSAASPSTGTAAFRLSLDGGLTYGQEVSLPTSGSYAIPNTGMYVRFSADTLVAGDKYTFSSTAASYTVSHLNTAIDALLAHPGKWFLLNLVGVPASTSSFAAVFAALDTKLTYAQNQFRYAAGLMSAPDVQAGTLISASRTLTSTRMCVAAGFASITSPLNGARIKRSASFAIAARAAAASPAEDLGYVAAGHAKGVQELAHDEFRTPGLDDARFSTLRSHIGLPGYYITNARIFSAANSDFQYLQQRRVMDIAAHTVRLGQLNSLNNSVHVDKTTGLILEVDARAIEAYITGLLRTAITQPGYASDVSANVDRTVNMLSTQKLVVHYRLTPLAYAKTIEDSIGFNNPALTPV